MRSFWDYLFAFRLSTRFLLPKYLQLASSPKAERVLLREAASIKIQIFYFFLFEALFRSVLRWSIYWETNYPLCCLYMLTCQMEGCSLCKSFQWSQRHFWISIWSSTEWTINFSGGVTYGHSSYFIVFNRGTWSQAFYLAEQIEVASSDLSQGIK